MRTAADQARLPRRRHSVRLWVISIIAFIVIGVIVLQAIANFYTNYLWYRSENLTYVWRGIVETKLTLASVFVALMFVGTWASLYAVDRMSTRVQLYAPELDLVRRYQTVVGHHTALVRTIAAGLVALLVGEGAAAQWQNWILFNHQKSFGMYDPLFGRDVGFFVFRLPFLDFVVSWTLLALIVIFVVTAIFHYLNGGIRIQGGGPHADPTAIAHLSLILGLAALVKAVSYYYVQRFELEYSTRGVAQGASYTDVHVELPAYTLLAVVALVAFGLLVFNVYQRTLSLPMIGIGLWVVVALSVGVIYPALLQAFRVTPAQSTLELPYIQDNITATNYAYGIGNIDKESYPATTAVSAAAANGTFRPTIDDADVWDPQQTIATFQKQQDSRNFFDISGLAVDRYTIGKTIVPEIVGVRTVTTSGLPSQSWVNTHLAYTHGFGMVMAADNTSTSLGGPSYVISNVPPASSGAGTPKLTQPRIYFGVQSSNYVVVDSAQPEVDYTSAGQSQAQVTSSYQGSGGIPIGSFWTRAAFALRFHDFSLLISKLVTGSSKIIYVQDVGEMVEKAAPFLQVDSNPYPVLDTADGQIYWLVDAYTTSSFYPYSQDANTSALPSGSGLIGNYNYVRNSVVVTVNSYTGAMAFYALPDSGGGPSTGDPILGAWESAFPGMFQPVTSMPKELYGHLRYPQDLLSVQATMYGKYHVTQAKAWYSGASAWEVAQSPTTGSPTEPLPTNPDGSVVRATPSYELLQLPATESSLSPVPGSIPRQPAFVAVEPMVPFSLGDKVQYSSGFLVAGCDLDSYGALTMYTTPVNSTIGPAVVDAEIAANTAISSQITVLDQKGSTVTAGALQILPVDNALIYLTPLYVSSSTNPFPELKFVVAVLGNTVAKGLPSAPGGATAQAIENVLASGVTLGGVGPTGQATAVQALQIKQILNSALSFETKAQAALKAGDLATYQADQKTVAALVKEARDDIDQLKPAPGSGSTGSTSSQKSGNDPPGPTGTTGTTPASSVPVAATGSTATVGASGVSGTSGATNTAGVTTTTDNDTGSAARPLSLAGLAF